MFCDVSQSRFVHLIGGEVPLHEVAVDRRSRQLTVPPSLLPDGGPPLVVSADAPGAALAHHQADGVDSPRRGTLSRTPVRPGGANPVPTDAGQPRQEDLI